METIKGLPEAPLWSIQFCKGTPYLFTHACEAFLFYGDRVEDLEKKIIVSRNVQEFMAALLAKESLGHPTQDHLIFHAFYELGVFWSGLRVKKEEPLGVWLRFKERTKLPQEFFTPSEKKSLNFNWEVPSFDDYKTAFDKGKFHLKRGDCYQYNLTFPFKAHVDELHLLDFLSLLWKSNDKVGEFAGYTQVLEKGFYSNSPECLFKINHRGSSYFLETRPIKGTIPLIGEDKDTVKQAWDLLSSCVKNESELFMITDLLRNDLNGIEKARVKVLDKKAPLVVPGLLHTYSHLEVELSSQMTLFEIMPALFPGGSITGAPKKRVIEIIEELESASRGFYCGSTILRSEENFRASINIRGGIWDKNNFCLSYHAGSGITFESTLEGEYEEMLSKHESLNSLLTNR